MTNKKSTKRALLMSLLAMLLCVTMLVGTTFAWFTDSVTSSGNIIKSGTLEIDLELLDAEKNVWSSIRDNPAPIFNYDKWEPGYTDVKLLKVQNEGTLSLKWKTVFCADNELGILAEVIDVYVCAYGVVADESTIAYPDDLDDYVRVGTVKQFIENIEMTAGSLLPGESAYLGIALKMQESAGNEYQGLTFAGGAFDIVVVTTQFTYEPDSFDEMYDKDAKFLVPVTSSIEMNDAFEAGGNFVVKKDVVSDSYLKIEDGVKVNMSLSDKTISASSIQNNGTIEVEGGGVELDYFENFGDATLNEVELNSGTAEHYGFKGKAGSNTVLNNVEFNSNGGAIAAVGGAKVEVNNTKVALVATTTDPRYNIYAEGAGSTVIVNSGEFSIKATTLKRAYVYAGAGTTVIINGGTFGAPSTRSGYTAGIRGTGTVIINGGTFGFDPSNWVADGYEAVQNGSTWTVSKIA